jgi:hypothetical protein
MSGSGYRPLTEVWDLHEENAVRLMVAENEAQAAALSTDTMILARSKVQFYGAYPAGFLGRARGYLCRETEPLLHVCGGMVKSYPFAGLGPLDRTVDLDAKTKPDYLLDVRTLGVNDGDSFPEGPMFGPVASICEMLPCNVRVITKASGPPPENQLWPAVLIDRPYTEDDAKKYLDGKGDAFLPDINDLLKRCLGLVVPGGRVGVLDYIWPQPPKKGARCVAAISVLVGFNNRVRLYSVYEREPKPWRTLRGARGSGESSEEDDDDVPAAAPAESPAPAPDTRGTKAPATPPAQAPAETPAGAAAVTPAAPPQDPYLHGITSRLHDYEKRDDDLASCRICKGGEGSLPRDCPGVAMTGEQQNEVYAGRLDFRHGAWVTLAGTLTEEQKRERDRKAGGPTAEAFLAKMRADALPSCPICHGDGLTNPDGEACECVRNGLRKALEKQSAAPAPAPTGTLATWSRIVGDGRDDI